MGISYFLNQNNIDCVIKELFVNIQYKIRNCFFDEQDFYTKVRWFYPCIGNSYTGKLHLYNEMLQDCFISNGGVEGWGWKPLIA